MSKTLDNILNLENDDFFHKSISSAQINILEQSKWLSASPINKLIQDKTGLLLLTMSPDDKIFISWVCDMKKQEIVIANKH